MRRRLGVPTAGVRKQHHFGGIGPTAQLQFVRQGDAVHFREVLVDDGDAWPCGGWADRIEKTERLGRVHCDGRPHSEADGHFRKNLAVSCVRDYEKDGQPH